MSLTREEFMEVINELKINKTRRHYLYPAKIDHTDGTTVFYVVIQSWIPGGRLQKVYLELKDEHQADRIIKKLADVIRLTIGNVRIAGFKDETPLKNRIAGNPKKVAKGEYEYRGFKIIDTYVPGNRQPADYRWLISEGKKTVQRCPKLKASLLYIDESLGSPAGNSS
ncbi:MAG: hypothetical protein CSA22_03130 [Deltaproteobacteria bacterium]|nr:MAG: hypothetical protein CSA22_03130 [Deltaproteobacteria bacterium]